MEVKCIPYCVDSVIIVKLIGLWVNLMGKSHLTCSMDGGVYVLFNHARASENVDYLYLLFFYM